MPLNYHVIYWGYIFYFFIINLNRGFGAALSHVIFFFLPLGSLCPRGYCRPLRAPPPSPLPDLYKHSRPTEIFLPKVKVIGQRSMVRSKIFFKAIAWKVLDLSSFYVSIEITWLDFQLSTADQMTATWRLIFFRISFETWNISVLGVCESITIVRVHVGLKTRLRCSFWFYRF